MIPSLSVEILELIISHVAEELNINEYNADKETLYILDALRACALTCSALRPRAHYHLFATVKIQQRPQARKIMRIHRQRLELTKCTKILLVRSLVSETRMDDPCSTLLVRFLSLFTNITTLAFHGINFNQPISSASRYTLDNVTQAISSTVYKLTCDACTFRHPYASRTSLLSDDVYHICCYNNRVCYIDKDSGTQISEIEKDPNPNPGPSTTHASHIHARTHIPSALDRPQTAPQEA
jgi:hypothetical protein